MTGSMSHVTNQTPDAMGLTTDGVVPVSSRELFWRARYLRKSSGLAHLPFVFWLFTDMQPRRTVTLNMGEGVLHFAACQAIDKLSVDALAQGYGTWDGAGVPEALINYNDAQYDEFSRLEEADAARAARRQQAGSVDLLIVETPDADALAAVQNNWPSKLSDRAVVLIPGIDHLDDAALSMLDALEAEHPTLRLDHGGGLRVLLMGTRAADRLRRLAEADPAHPALMTVGRIFGRLGALHVNEWTARDKTAWARQLEDALRKSEEKAAALQSDGAALQARLKAARRNSKSVKRQTKALAKRQSAIDAAQDDIDRLRSWIEALKSDLAEARESATRQAEHQAETERTLIAKADALTAELETATRALHTAETMLRTTQDEATHLITERDTLRATLAHQTTALEDAQTKATERAAQLAGLRGELSGVRGALEAARRAVTETAAKAEAQAKTQADEARRAMAQAADDLAQTRQKATVTHSAMQVVDARRVTALAALRDQQQQARATQAKLEAALAQERGRTRLLSSVLNTIDTARVTHVKAAAAAQNAMEAAQRAHTQDIADLTAQADHRTASALRDAHTKAQSDLSKTQAAHTAALIAETDKSAALEEAKTAAQAALAKAQKALTEAQAQAKEQAETEAASHAKALTKIQTELKKAKDEIVKTQQARDEAEARAQKATADPAEVAQLWAALKETEETSIQRAEALKAANRTITELTAEIEAGSGDNSATQAEIEGMHATIAQLQQDLVRQADELAAAELAIAQGAQSAASGAEVEDLRLTLARERAALRELRETHEAEKARTNTVINKLTAAITAKSVELKSAQTSQATQDTGVTALRDDLRRAQAQLANLAAQNAQLQHDYEAMRHSTSWRVTAPMRQLSTALKRDPD